MNCTHILMICFLTIIFTNFTLQDFGAVNILVGINKQDYIYDFKLIELFIGTSALGRHGNAEIDMHA